MVINISQTKLINTMINRVLAILSLVLATGVSTVMSQPVPSPKEHFGFNIGDDYKLATYTQTESYFKKLAASERVKLVDIGPTEEGRRQYMLIISSPDNIRNLERYREISVKLARAGGLNDDEARRLASQGKAVVWIDGGLHATEVVGTHQLIETAWKLASRTDKETLEILDNVIVLLVHANPDGQELVSSWYMREEDTLKRRTNIPRLYQKYIGHDNNRDFFMSAMQETRNMNRQLYLEWIPQILYNHHQSGPAGTILAGPPYRDPFNYVFDPLVVTGIDALGAAMINRLNTEDKPGYTQRTGASFSTWYNGGLRTTSYFHNIIGLLTEIIGGPTPSEVPLVVNRLLPNGANPYPVTPRTWHFRQSIDYSVSLNYAVLLYASRNRSDVLYNIYRMGMNSIERGSRDYVTVTPKIIESIREAWQKETGASGRQAQGQISEARIPLKYYEQVMKDPAKRDARAYIIPSGQKDFPTAVRFVNALIMTGIEIHKASSAFTVAGKNYPAGSYVIKTAQAFRPHIIDMFEPQDHPDDLQYPGGPPIPPYDAAGWTLALQMGFSFDRVTDDISGPFVKIPLGETQSVAVKFMPLQSFRGFLLSPETTNTFKVINDLIAGGAEVHRVTSVNVSRQDAVPGDFYVPSSSVSNAILARSSAENGVPVKGTNQRPAVTEKVTRARIAIWDRYGGSMQTGWIKWILEQYNFGYTIIYPQAIDSGELMKNYDVIILPSGAVPAYRGPVQPVQGQAQPVSAVESIPPEFRYMTGSLTAERSVPQLKSFLEEGGVIITLGTSTSLANHIGLPVRSALVKTGPDGNESPLSNSEFYIPGSLLAVAVDSTTREGWGMASTGIVYFDRSQVFVIEENKTGQIRKVLWFEDEKPLRSGWALGQNYLKNGVAAFSANVGKGKLFACGPDITFRSQSQGTFRIMFNQLYSYQIKR